MTSADETAHQAAMKVLICGGIAGIVTWASVFPLDVIKTRLQAQSFLESSRDMSPETRSLLRPTMPREWEIARQAYRTEGFQVFYRGLGVCSIRAFIVNSVQVCCSIVPGISQILLHKDGSDRLLIRLSNTKWATYEWLMKVLSGSLDPAQVGI